MAGAYNHADKFGHRYRLLANGAREYEHPEPSTNQTDLAGREWRTTPEERLAARLFNDLETALAKIEALEADNTRLQNEVYGAGQIVDGYHAAMVMHRERAEALGAGATYESETAFYWWTEWQCARGEIESVWKARVTALEAERDEAQKAAYADGVGAGSLLTKTVEEQRDVQQRRAERAEQERDSVRRQYNDLYSGELAAAEARVSALEGALRPFTVKGAVGLVLSVPGAASQVPEVYAHCPSIFETARALLNPDPAEQPVEQKPSKLLPLSNPLPAPSWNVNDPPEPTMAYCAAEQPEAGPEGYGETRTVAVYADGTKRLMPRDW